MSQESFRNEFLGLFVVFPGVVNVPDVDEDGSTLRDAMAIINVVLGGGVGDCLRGDGTPAMDLLSSFSVF